MILHHILEHDLHRSKKDSAIPYLTEIPFQVSFFPAIYSSTKGNFLVARNLTKAVHTKDGVRIAHQSGKKGPLTVGVFAYDPDRIDDLIPSMMDAAYKLSVDDRLGNIFIDPQKAFLHIQKQSGLPFFPHICLIPTSWTETKIKSFFGRKNLRFVGKKDDHVKCRFMEFCKVIPTSVTIPVFLSKPEMVGMYTQYVGGDSCIVIHNVKSGLAFIAPSSES